MTYVRFGAGTSHLVSNRRPTHTVCGRPLERDKKDKWDSGHPARQVPKSAVKKVCSDCDRMKNADTVRER